MSGGALDYACYDLNRIVERLREEEHVEHLESSSIVELLSDLSDVLHAYEWWRSGDYSKERYVEMWNQFESRWLKEVDEK